MWFERVSHSQCLLNLFWHCRFCVLICPPAPPSTEAAGWAALSAHSPLWAFFMPSHKSKGPGGEGLTWPCPQFPWIFSLRIWNGSSANSWKKSFEFKYSFYYCNPNLAAWSTLLQGVVAICPCCSCNWVYSWKSRKETWGCPSSQTLCHSYFFDLPLLDSLWLSPTVLKPYLYLGFS